MNKIQTKIVDDIKRDGLSVVAVFSDENGPGFAYSVGLEETYGQPELFLSGLPANTALQLMHVIVKEYAATHTPVPTLTRINTIANGLDCMFLEADHNVNDYIIQCNEYYHHKHRDGVRVVQMVWPDQQNNFPWEPGFDDSFRESQVILNSEMLAKMAAPEPKNTPRP